MKQPTSSVTRRSFLAGSAVAAAAAGLALTGCGSNDTASTSNTDSNSSTTDSTPEGSGSKELRASMSYQTENFLPFNNSSGLAQGANWNAIEGLYMLDMATMKPYPALADGEPTQVSDTEYEVKLRDGAKFSDGTDVTANDVVESFNRTMGAEGALYASMLNFIDSMEAKDDQTITIKLNKATSLLTQRLPLAVVCPASATDEDLTKKPIGSGPYMYESVSGTDGGQLVYVPNPHYNGNHPAGADKLIYDIIIDDTARTTSLTDGTAQIMENVPSNLVATAQSTGAVAENAMGFAVGFMMFNTKKAPFDDVRVRQAFLYAIDYDKMIMNALPDVATRPDSFLPATHQDYLGPASVAYTYDAEKAKSLLADAGVTDLSIVIDTTDAGWITAMAPQIQSNLADIGVNATIQTQASSSLYANRCDTDEEIQPFDIVVAPGDPGCFGTDPDLLMNWWYGDNSWTQKRSCWKDSEGYTKLHSLMDEAFTLEGDDQKKKWGECFDLLSEEVPLYPIVHRQVVTAYYADKVNNFIAIGSTGLRFMDVTPA